MNIVIVGGGSPGKLGNRFAIQAQQQGHSVISISHKEHYNNNVKTVVCDFNDHREVSKKFEEVATQLGNIDLLLYCSRNYSATNNITIENFNRGDLDINDYYNTLTTNVIIPHSIALIGHKLKLPMHMIFFTTNLAVSFKEEKEYRKYSSYIGSKAWQLHLMRGLSAINSTINASAISVHFNWDNSQADEDAFIFVYNLITNNYQRTAGKIISAIKIDQPQIIELEVLDHCPRFEYIGSSGDARDSNPRC